MYPDVIVKPGKRAGGVASSIAKVESQYIDEDAGKIAKLEKELEIEPWKEFVKNRPGKYEEWMAEKAFMTYAKASGNHVITKKGIARRLRINEHTLHEWIAKHEAFRHAIHAGEELQEERLASKMISAKYVQGYFGVLKNLHRWADKIDAVQTIDLSDALKQQAAGAKRVNWDKPVIDVPQISDGTIENEEEKQ